MSRIFISYRREDTSGYAGRLSERLRAHFGDDQVFMDIDAIEPGLDYQEFIEMTIDSVDVMVALIGREWLTTRSPAGGRRLDDADDFVRLEVAGALERRVRVIPVLVEGAPMPTVHDLPAPLVPLARRNAIEVSNSRWDYDCERLMSAVERALGGVPPSSPPAAAPAPAKLRPAPSRSTGLVAVAAAAAVVSLIWGVFAPRNWHDEWNALRLVVEVALVVMVAVGLRRKEWRLVLAAGVLGVAGLSAWAQFLIVGGHSFNDLFGSPDAAANWLALVASIVVLGSGLAGWRLVEPPEASR